MSVENRVLNCDCMDYMINLPDKYFDIVVTSPPFGIGQDWTKDRKSQHYNVKSQYSNDRPPNDDYLKQILRVSKNQIIGGYNYIADKLPITNHLILWNKCRDVKKTHRSEGVLFWTSFSIPLRVVSIIWDGAKKGKETGRKTIHPHEWPMALCKWFLTKFVMPGDRIFDPYTGSGKLRLVCHDMGIDFVGCEKDKIFCEKQELRYLDHISQAELFPVEDYQERIFG